MQTLLKDADDEIERFAPVINACFDRIRGFSEDNFRLFVRSYYQINKIADVLLSGPGNYPTDYGAINRLLIKNYRHTYDYWLSEADPLEWIRAETGEANLPDDLEKLFVDILHTDILREKEKLAKIDDSGKKIEQTTLEGLLVLTTYNQIVERYRSVPQELFQVGSENGKGNYWKVI